MKSAPVLSVVQLSFGILKDLFCWRVCELALKIVTMTDHDVNDLRLLSSLAISVLLQSDRLKGLKCNEYSQQLN